MKLRGKIKITEEDGSLKEIVGEPFPYTYGNHQFQLVVHESVLPWTPNVLDITEATTGCRCCSTDKPVSSTTKTDIINAMDKFISDKGLKNLLEQIKKRKHPDLTR